MTAGTKLELLAPAKLNLALAVGPARESDGMHPIASWMAPIGLCDTITMQRLGDGEQSRFEIVNDPAALRPAPIDWDLESDLAVRAVRAIEAEAGKRLPVAMRVEKRIPVGAGLGGGSSDAAAALRGVRDLFELSIAYDRLAELALGLGSDVPFFLYEGPALVTGFGETIERTPQVTGAEFVTLFAPPFACATGAVYGAFDRLPPAGFRAAVVEAMARSGQFRDVDCFNDLAAAAESVEPSLAEFRARISAAASVPAHVTGSGSAVFTISSTFAEAERILETARRYVGSIAGAVTKIRA